MLFDLEHIQGDIGLLDVVHQTVAICEEDAGFLLAPCLDDIVVEPGEQFRNHSGICCSMGKGLYVR